MPKRPATPSKAPVVPLIILILLIAVIYFAYNYWQQHQPPTTTTPATQPADLTSDERIIFGGAPKPHRAEIAFTVLKNSAYIVGYSETRKDPLWSASRVIYKEHPFILERPKGEFLTDPRTEAKVTHHDFTGSGFDRGHMTPNSLIARCFGEQAQKETFLLSNICPQAPALNQKVWEKLEVDELTYADQLGEIWVVCGPIFADLNGGTTPTLRSGIAVPSAFYKILIDDHTGVPRVFSVIMPQTVKGTELPQQYLTSIRQIEDQTQLEFLWKLDPDLRESLETNVWHMW